MHLTRTEMIEAIDSAADYARARIVGDPIRVVEYQVAEKDALAYKDAGYTGTVPPSVAVWAAAKGWTAQQSADDILNAATLWRQALIGLRQARLAGKEGVRQAVDEDAADAAHEQAVLAIKNILRQVIGT